jgi:hypothetical protein
LAVEADGLCGCQEMVFVERGCEGRAPVPGSAIGYPLGAFCRVWLVRKVCGDQAGEINEFASGSRLAGIRVDCHGLVWIWLSLKIGDRGRVCKFF